MFTYTPVQNLLSLLGRILIALLFVPAGIGKIAGFATTAGDIAARGFPFPTLSAFLAVVIELGFGLLLLVGYKTRWAALGMAFFTLIVSAVFHNYWALPAELILQNEQAFYKNFAVLGGLLGVAAWGAGAWSIDGWCQRKCAK